jgi:sigma-B regulation protein RsbU (phosphoserine phosphatase)
VAGAYISAKEVGGDYYDFIEYDDGRLGILIADVSGKSLPGMLFMLLTRNIVRTLARSLADPAKLLCEVNRELLRDMKKGTFVTMAFGVLDRQTGRFVFASSGHNPVLVVRGAKGHVATVKTKGFPLGMVGPEAYEKRLESREITLGTDDWVVLYTDGVNEAKDEAGEEFGEDRLTEMIARWRGASADEMVSQVLAHQQEFVGNAVQYDDITLLALKWTGKHADTELKRPTETAYAS